MNFNLSTLKRNTKNYLTPMYYKKLDKSQFEIVIAERQQKDVCSDISSIVHKRQGNYLFMGSFGRKGEQENQFRVGKTVLKLVINMKIKNDCKREDNDSKGFNFVVASDGTQSSFKGYKVLKHFLKENDKIYTLSMCKEGEEDCSEKIIKFQKENNIESENIFEKCSKESLLENKLVSSLNNNEKHKFDFLVVSIRGLHEKQGKLGNTTTHILVHSKMNILLVP